MTLHYLYLLSIILLRYYHPEDPGYVNIYISGYQNTTIQYLLPWEDISREIQLEESNNWTWSISIRLNREKEDACNGYTAIPLTNYSTEFLLSSQQTTTRSIGHQIYVVGAASEGASISLHNNSTDADNDDKEATSLQHLQLAPYEMLEIVGDQINITGLYLTSDHPIVVYSGHQCGNVPVGISYCEPLFQQIPPLLTVGKDYITGPIRRRDKAGYTVRIIATRLDTVVDLLAGNNNLQIENANLDNCTLSTNDGVASVECLSPLGVGSYVDVLVIPSTVSLRIKCSAPCYVYQMNHGGSQPQIGVRADPFMALVAPISQRTATVRFSTIASYTEGHELLFRNFVTVIARRSDRILLDDAILPPDNGINIGDNKVYSQEIRHGFHEVRTSDGQLTNLVVQIYGHGPNINFSGAASYGLAGTFLGKGNSDIFFSLMIKRRRRTPTSSKPQPQSFDNRAADLENDNKTPTVYESIRSNPDTSTYCEIEDAQRKSGDDTDYCHLGREVNRAVHGLVSSDIVEQYERIRIGDNHQNKKYVDIVG
ncbi:hypothetical protein LSH36_1189g00083 [Paralvinella palmiformis]|uniref:IgGFc-binding protein N-terminal domain-containing protein n=1 Tax=Paralvinella palmiformis TaxID=53620 RepID=A0AAD9IUL4_9ANNE|nr:hypothetical protein LSH36_1189g00083 [Paralvinella palmiformis]